MWHIRSNDRNEKKTVMNRCKANDCQEFDSY